MNYRRRQRQGKIGKISNFGAVGDGSDKGNVGKISNFGELCSIIILGLFENLKKKNKNSPNHPSPRAEVPQLR